MTKHPFIKLPFRGLALALLLGLVGAARGSVPSTEVTVFNPSGEVAFKGTINAKATFATRSLEPGQYVVQFRTRTAAVRDNQYLLVVSAGSRKVIAAAVPGETLADGGAAMKIDVGPGSNITGQIMKEEVTTAAGEQPKSRMVNGKRFFWVASELGSNRGGHWVAEGLAPALNVVMWRKDDLQKRLDRGGEGSMIPRAYPALVSGKGY